MFFLLFCRFAGYLIYPFLLYVGHTGGAKSKFMSIHSSSTMRLICYTIAPVVALISIYSRIRYVLTSLLTFFFLFYEFEMNI